MGRPRGVGRPRRQEGRRCGRRGGRHQRGMWNARSGGGSLRAAPVRRPRSRAACQGPSGRAGSVTVAACRRRRWPSPRAGTCRSPSGRRSPCCGYSRSEAARSPAGWVVARRRSPASCAATRPHAEAGWTTAPRSRSGTPNDVRAARRSRSWPLMSGCASTCRTVSQELSTAPTAARSRGRTCRGRDAGTGGGLTAAGAARGARSRSAPGCGSTSPTMRRCASPMRPSTRRCTSRAAARCAAT